MVMIYLVAFLMWILLAVVYIFIKRQSKMISKSKETGGIYITPKVYLVAHSDNVIYTLYKKDKVIADDVLECHQGILHTTFVTIFATIDYNHITGKFVRKERSE